MAQFYHNKKMKNKTKIDDFLNFFEEIHQDAKDAKLEFIISDQGRISTTGLSAKAIEKLRKLVKAHKPSSYSVKLNLGIASGTLHWRR